MANTQQTEKKQSAKQKKILVASILLAAAITVGSTFAWFTSKDEVTNRLTASANYGVSITETFTPPEDWVPGQTINKDVGAVNTGNVDAFVKLTVSNEMILTRLNGSEDYDANNTSKYVILGTAESHNTDTQTGITTNTADEVSAIQAGALLAYTSAEFNAEGEKSPVGTIVADKTAGSDTEFKPYKTGVYIFRRTVKNESTNNDVVTESFVYDGYYYVSDTSDTSNAGGKGTYYRIAVDNFDNNQDYLYKYDSSADNNNVDENGIFINNNVPTYKLVKKETIHFAPELSYDSTNKKIVATYNGGTADDTSDDIVIDINLATDYADNWTADGNTEFYLNEILKAGATSPDLIDSVKLSDATTSKAYLNFDYDLKIALDSAQVTYNDSGNATAEAVTADTTTWTLTPAVTYDSATNKNKVNWSTKTP